MGTKPNKTQSKSTRGVFCLEGEWENNLKRRHSIEPVLQLLSNVPPYVPFVHRDAATREQLFYYLEKWTQRQYDSHPILYLAYHGGKEEIYVGDGRKNSSVVTLDELEESLEGKCSGRIIHFGTCKTLDIHGARINRFVRQTKALAVCGYRESIDIVKSAAFELLVFDAFQHKTLTLHGARAMQRTIQSQANKLSRDLGFRMVTRSSK